MRVSGLSDPNEWSSVMLILTRRVGETLMIGDQVTVTVLGVKGNQVRIGITAPAHITVHRKEVYDAIQRENREAANIQPKDLPPNPGGNPPPQGPNNPRRRGP